MGPRGLVLGQLSQHTFTVKLLSRATHWTALEWQHSSM